MRIIISILGVVAACIIAAIGYVHDLSVGFGASPLLLISSLAYCVLVLWLCFGFKGKKNAGRMLWIAFGVVLLVSTIIAFIIINAILNFGDLI